MILIISVEQDESTIEVCKWLAFYDVPFVIVNKENLISEITYEIGNDVCLSIGDRTISFSQIKFTWYRKGNITLFDYEIIDNSMLSKEINKYSKSERLALIDALHRKLLQKPNLANYLTSKVNKLDVLEKASKIGITIPNTLICCNKVELIKFAKKFKDGIICKVMDSPINYYADKYWLPMYTEKITSESYEMIPDSFAPSYFQENIKKKYEIRSVLLNNCLYSMAIFSQSNEQTKVDFRRYDYDLPNRTVPYVIPASTEKQLKKLTNLLNIGFCSIDMIVNEYGEHIFLEINPVGQFGMTSVPCNYYIEKQLALIIKNKLNADF